MLNMMGKVMTTLGTSEGPWKVYRMNIFQKYGFIGVFELVF
jgi:hypothetical protein